jgi:protein O-GlcNAc transferase
MTAHHHNFGPSNQLLSQTEQEVASYQQILRVQPQNADAHCCLGNSLRLLGRFDEAVLHCREALRWRPGFAGAHNNLGLALAGQGKLEEASAQYRQALCLHPHYAAAHNNLGLVLLAQARFDEAVAHYRQALQIKPDYASAWYNLGIALMEQGHPEEALSCFQQAVQLNPANAAAHNNLGLVLTERGRLNEAIGCFHQALRINPNLAEAHNNLGCVLERQLKLEEAISCYRQALALRPNYAKAYTNLGNVYKEQGRFDEALANYREALRLRPDMAAAHSNLLFCLNYHPHADPDVVFAEHRRWGQVHGLPTAQPRHANDPNPERRLRIGYVSPDLRDHAVTRYLEPVLTYHDSTQVEIFCYAEVPQTDAVSTRLQNLASGWRLTCRLPDAEVAQCIRSDAIDILVDLAGHTAFSRLRVFAHKPAPVQATWLGYLNTTGLDTVDYRLTDDILDPPGQPVRDTEELLRLPAGMCCFGPPPDAPAISPLPALQRGHLTFGSLHSLFKLNPGVFDLWSQVLLALPTARLLMFRHTLTEAAQEQIRQQFAARGIAPDRLDLRKGWFTPGYLRVYEEIDVSLDTFPCTGGVTTCESMWMGVPVLTLSGVRPVGRNSAALLTRAGLADWHVETPEHYVDFAKRLQNDLGRLAELRSHLRQQMLGTLCDAPRFTRSLEDAYRTMWRRWCTQRA